MAAKSPTLQREAAMDVFFFPPGYAVLPIPHDSHAETLSLRRQVYYTHEPVSYYLLILS